MWKLYRKAASILPISVAKRFKADSRSKPINEILENVRARDGLAVPKPHIEYLIAGAGTQQNVTDAAERNDLDIADKTQLILQSAHPIRHIVEREIFKLKDGHKDVSYHNWVTIFGRCLGTKKYLNSKDHSIFEERLNFVANAAECGMFSSDVHQTVLNIPVSYKEEGISDEQWKQLQLGNKYAILVGDYFAIKTIFYAQKTGVNKVFLCITRGIEDFASVPFASGIIQNSTWYPFVPSPGTNFKDWEAYATKSPGYFTGALYAVLTIINNAQTSDTVFLQHVKQFCINFCLFLKLLNEIEQVSNPSTSISPLLCVSLPAILHQEQNPDCFSLFKKMGFLATHDDFKKIQNDLKMDNKTMQQVHNLVSKYAAKTHEYINIVGDDSFYQDIFHKLVDVLLKRIPKI